MSLTAATISMSFGWTDSITPVSGGKAVRYNDSLALNPTINISTYNQQPATSSPLPVLVRNSSTWPHSWTRSRGRRSH